MLRVGWVGRAEAVDESRLSRRAFNELIARGLGEQSREKSR